MRVYRWFKNVTEWFQVKRDIPATLKEQGDFYREGIIPPNATEEDVRFLIEGTSLKPEETLDKLAAGVETDLTKVKADILINTPGEFIKDTKIVNVIGKRFGDFLIFGYISPKGKGVMNGTSQCDTRWRAQCVYCGATKDIRGKKYNDTLTTVCKARACKERVRTL
jgi:hypothetical protein